MLLCVYLLKYSVNVLYLDFGILPHCRDGQLLEYILLYSYPMMKVTGVYVANMYRHSHICINTNLNACDCLNSV